jgi:hypothetical protein
MSSDGQLFESIVSVSTVALEEFVELVCEAFSEVEDEEDVSTILDDEVEDV